jgi:hypothetical protein
VTVIAGIDEAGYGPLLGPLVTTCAALRSAQEPEDPGEFWDSLREVVCRPGRGSAGRLVVGDSKKVYSGESGLARLEQAVLAFLGAAGTSAETVEEVAGAILSPECLTSLRAHPWYSARGERLPLASGPVETAAGAQGLSRCCAAQEIEVLPVRSRLLAEGEFNRRVAREDNKATVLAGLVAGLLRDVRAQAGAEPLAVYIDRLGGRTDYAAFLGGVYPGAFVWEEFRSPARQYYRIEGLPGPTRVEFRVRADSHCFPVALASMTSKYLRELFMRRLNEYWRSIDPQVPETSGYYADAGRFLQAVAPHQQSMGIAQADLVRCR